MIKILHVINVITALNSEGSSQSIRFDSKRLNRSSSLLQATWGLQPVKMWKKNYQMKIMVENMKQIYGKFAHERGV